MVAAQGVLGAFLGSRLLMGDDLDDTAIVWFRRDLRVHDQPIFDVAAARAKRSLAVFVLDETLLGPSGKARRTFLYRSLRDLDESLGGRLLVVRGDPAEVIPKLAGAVTAGSVHIAADFGPYGTRARRGRREGPG